MPEHDNIKRILGNLRASGLLKKCFQHTHDFDDIIRDLLRKKNPKWQWENSFAILKRYNSYSPVVPRKSKLDDIQTKGGGYFLNWGEKGIAIDPGFDYLKNLHNIGLGVGNIDAIILTHGHNDHYSSIDPILTLIHQLNSLYKKRKAGAVSYIKKDWSSALEYFKLGLEVESRDKICANGREGCLAHMHIKEIPELAIKKIDTEITSYLEEAEESGDDTSSRTIDLFLGRSAEKTITSITPLPMEQIRNVYLLHPYRTEVFREYNMKITAVPAKHWDFYSKSYCLGLKLNLLDEHNDEKLTIGLTSDTGYYFKNDLINSRTLTRELWEEYLDCSLLVAHIGSIKEKEVEWLDDTNGWLEDVFKAHSYPMHLGILGLLRLIDKLKGVMGDKLQLVIISEYGEELKEIRKELTDTLNSSRGFDKKPPIRSGDIGLVIKLEEQLKVLVDSYHLATPNNMYQNAIDPADVKEHYRWGPIKYSA